MYPLLMHEDLPLAAFALSHARLASTESTPAEVSALPNVIRTHGRPPAQECRLDRKSTRLNSSHTVISYAVFCLKKKKNITFSCMPMMALWKLIRTSHRTTPATPFHSHLPNRP